MNAKQVRFWGGIATVVAALTAYSKTKKWEEVHTFAVIGGTVLSLSGGL
jgi:hypothetical protein